MQAESNETCFNCRGAARSRSVYTAKVVIILQTAKQITQLFLILTSSIFHGVDISLAYPNYSNIHLFNYDRKVFTKFGDLNSVGGCVRDGIERIIICIMFYYIIYYI